MFFSGYLTIKEYLNINTGEFILFTKNRNSLGK